MIKVSVIIPNYNHASFLKKRIETILNQSFTDFELIILDDASTDSSRSIIESYSTDSKISQIIYNEVNSGSPFLQWKKGIEIAKGNWIWIAESDDFADPDFLLLTIEKAKECGETGLVYCDSYIMTDFTADKTQSSFADRKNKAFNTDKWLHPYCQPGEQEINESLKWECVINNVSAVLFKRIPLLKEISHAIEYRYHGDWLIYLRMAKYGKIAYIPQPLNYYREHENNHSKSENYSRQSKIEHFAILNYLLELDFINEKNKLFSHFINQYVGFGFINEPGFGKKGIFKEYAAINLHLSRKLVFTLLLNKLKIKKSK